jgi:TATA-box binding protein (TBP) (component of TFIID and TFIIIB)
MNLEFEDINISTTTVIATTNMTIQLEWLYAILPVYEPQRTNFRKNQDYQQYITSQNPQQGTITYVQFKSNNKGFRPKKNNGKYFRNTLTVMMYVGKLITIKIPSKGKLQMTGCANEEHAISCVKHLWNYIKKHPSTEKSYIIQDKNFTSTFRTVMTDIVFDLGFNVNRQNLDRYMNTHTEFNSLLETSFGYTGVNIKIPFLLQPQNMKVSKITYNEDKWTNEKVSYLAYLNTLEEKERKRELKPRKNTFLVFHSGKVIISGMTLQYMKKEFYTFVQIMNQARKDIEENIEI